MKLENNWRYKTLDNLEKNVWGAPDYDSYLVRRCHELRTVPLNNFTTEDLRIMIGQQIGLHYLIPIALEVLTGDLFAEGDFYEGDLLNNVLNIDTEYWDGNKTYWSILDALTKNRRPEIAQNKISMVNFDMCRYNGFT